MGASTGEADICRRGNSRSRLERFVAMEDVKAMARAKRASSKRGRARHSHSNKHAHTAAVGTVPAAGGPAAREKNAPEEVLPSNWERYSDGGGSADEGAAPPLDGEVLLKSKGADYCHLLSSDGPQLFEDLPGLCFDANFIFFSFLSFFHSLF